MAITHDYLMRQLVMLAEAIRRALQARREGQDALELEETSKVLGIATSMEPETLLRMDARSFVTMMELSATDASAAVWVVAALELQQRQHLRAGNATLSALRAEQAAEVRRVYAIDESLDLLLERAEQGDATG